ncbi:16S rRNA processing protein RimM [hydrothermal vent metagenome]|uniref:16S rRNA processing protein RimM n=1 Tax=hydrothermal vent metagenome TaxID=652676 RepID=A0A3B0ZDA0_9ZZZZ
MLETEKQRVLVGRVSTFYGLKGGLKIFSYTDPRENIINYSPWQLNCNGEWRVYDLLSGRRHGKTVIAQLRGIENRDQAATLIGVDISVWKNQLPTEVEGEYYWADLIGLNVINTNGIALGQVKYLIETGANDVLVLAGERERLIPYVKGSVVLSIDLNVGVIQVDWDPDF